MSFSALFQPELLYLIALLLLGLSFYLIRLKRIRESKEFITVSWNIKREFETELAAIAPHIYNRPTRVSPEVESYTYKGRFWRKSRRRLLLRVTLSSAEDKERVESMIKRFVEEFQTRAGHHKYRARIFLESATTIERRRWTENEHH